MSLDPEELYTRLRALGEKWADADAAWHFLDDATKSVLAECEAEAKLREGHKTEASLERAARQAPKYREHLEALSAARKAANRAKISFDCYRAYIELLRSKAALDRAEMSLR